MFECVSLLPAYSLTLCDGPPLDVMDGPTTSDGWACCKVTEHEGRANDEDDWQSYGSQRLSTGRPPGVVGVMGVTGVNGTSDM